MKFKKPARMHGEVGIDTAAKDDVVLENDSDSECCLNFLEILAIVFSLVILGFACAYYIALGGIMQDFTFESATVCLIVSAALIALSGILTEIGIVRHDKYMFAFEVVMAFSAIIVIGTGIAFIRYTRFFDRVADNQLSNSLDEDILSYGLAVFERCCSENNPLPESCDSNDFTYPCFPDSNEYRSNLIQAGDACFILETAGAVSRDPDGCGGQEVIAFLDEFMGFLSKNTFRMGLINIILGLIILIINGSEGLLAFNYHQDKFNRPANFDDPELHDFKKKHDEAKKKEKKNKKWFSKFGPKKSPPPKTDNESVEEEAEDLVDGESENDDNTAHRKKPRKSDFTDGTEEDDDADAREVE